MNVHFLQGVLDARGALGKRWPVAAAGAALAILFGAAVLEGEAAGSAGSARAVQLRLLGGVAFGLILPLFAFGISARLGGRRPELMALGWGRHGGDRRVYALGRQALGALCTGLVVASCGVLALGLGSATSAPGVALPTAPVNVLMVIWIGLLAGLAYVALLGLAHVYAGSTGRLLFLFGDWVFGGASSAVALPWPRAHLRALLGGSAPLGLAPRDAALCLGALTLLACLAYARRVPR